MANLTGFLAPFEAIGLKLLDDHKAALLQQARVINQNVVDALEKVVIANLPTKGLAGMIDGGLRVALLAAEPQIISALGSAESDLISMVENIIKKQMDAPAAPAPAPTKSADSKPA